MTDETDQPPIDAGEARDKRPYERPRVADSAIFETLALTCGKQEGDGGCVFSPGGLSAS